MLGGHRAVEKGVGRFLLGVCSANRDLVGGSAAFRALQLRDTAVGNYFFLAINKIILRRTRWGKSNWGSFTYALPRSAALDDKAMSWF